jgi:hypothetical protein
VVRNPALTRRLRLDLETDLTGLLEASSSGSSSGGGVGSRARKRPASLCARATVEASQQLGASCLASATVGADVADRDAGLAWGLAVERRLVNGGSSKGGGGSSSSGSGGLRSLRSVFSSKTPLKVGARLFCERSYGRQLLLSAQRLVGSGARWVDAGYMLHARGGARQATLRCALLGGGNAESAVALSHRWRLGNTSGRAGAGSMDGRWRSTASGVVVASSGGQQQQSKAKVAPQPSKAGGGGGGNAQPGQTGSLVLSGTQVAAGRAGGGSSGGSSSARAEPPTWPPPQPRWEVATSATYSSLGGWGYQLQFIVHRGDRLAWQVLPACCGASGAWW